jgi:hypothetical protein
MARELFIYWKLDVARAEGAAAAAAAMQRELLQVHPELQAGVYRRTDARGGIATLMETYASAETAGVGLALQAAIEAASARHLRDWRDGPRHVEAFDRLAG